MTWQEQGNCQGTDTEAFFVPDGQGTYENVTALKRICSSCPVLDECFDYALHHSVLGWWGGTGERTRSNLRGKLNIVPIQITTPLRGEAW